MNNFPGNKSAYRINKEKYLRGILNKNKRTECISLRRVVYKRELYGRTLQRTRRKRRNGKIDATNEGLNKYLK